MNEGWVGGGSERSRPQCRISVAMSELESRPLACPTLPSGAGKAKAACVIWLLSAKVSYFYGLH